MDPLSIVSAAGASLSTAKTAWEVGSSLYIFIEAAKKVDKTLEAFAEEIKSLGAACEVVGHRLTDIHNGAKDQGDDLPFGRADKLWKCLQEQVSACQKTIVSLQEAVEIPRGAQNVKFFEKAVKQIILNLRAADIDDARNRIRSHTASLQILLQGMAIEITYLTPHRADQQLQTQLHDLAKKNKELTSLLAERESSMFDEQTNEEAILRESSQILSSGETLYATSVAGGSMFGDLDPTTEGRISNWITHTNDLDRLASGPSSTTETDTTSVWTEGIGATTEDTLSIASPPDLQRRETHLTMPYDEQDEDLDSDDEFAIEAATHAIDAGRQAFETRDYESTNAMLQEALTMLRELPVSQQKRCDPGEMRYMLSVCAFHLQDPPAAKVALLSVIEHTGSAKQEDDKRRRQICDAGHLLSQTCIRLGELEQARTYCESSMKGRRRLLGKTHEETYESMALMVRVLELLGMVDRAKVFARMLPEEKRSLIVAFRNLNVQVSQQDAVSRVGSIQRKPVQATTGQNTTAGAAGSSTYPDEKSGNGIAGPMGRMSLSSNPHAQSGGPAGGLRNPHLQQWVQSNGYTRPRPMSQDPTVRKLWHKKFRLAIKTKLLTALAAGRDVDALFLARGEKQSFFEMKFYPGHPPELHLAALYGLTDVVAALLQAGADVTYKSRMGMQPLHCAAAAGYVEVARMLIAAGAPIDDPSDIVGTPLCLAVLRRRLDVVDLLLQYNADPLSSGGKLGSPLHMACATNNVALVQALSTTTASFAEVREVEIDTFWNVTSDDMAGNRDKAHHTTHELEHPIVDPLQGFARTESITAKPLEFAAFRGCGAVVAHLLSREVYIDSHCTIRSQYRKDYYGHTALSLAAMGGSAGVAASLLRHVAPEAPTSAETPDALLLAVANRHEAVANLLLDAGARPTDAMVHHARDVYHMAAKGKPMPELVARLERVIKTPVVVSGGFAGLQRRETLAGGSQAGGGEDDPPPEYFEG